MSFSITSARLYSASRSDLKSSQNEVRHGESFSLQRYRESGDDDSAKKPDVEVELMTFEHLLPAATPTHPLLELHGIFHVYSKENKQNQNNKRFKFETGRKIKSEKAAGNCRRR